MYPVDQGVPQEPGQLIRNEQIRLCRGGRFIFRDLGYLLLLLLPRALFSEVFQRILRLIIYARWDAN